MPTALDYIYDCEEDLRLVTEAKKKPAKIKKRCLHCGRKYKGVTALSVKPIKSDKPEPGRCPRCRRENHLSEEDLGGQELGLEIE